MKILGTICARGGSKGVKNKNIKKLLDKPLIAYTIEYFKKWGKIDRIVCSTDSPEIANIAEKYGADIPYIRPKELAGDHISKLSVLKDLIQFCEKQDNTTYDIIVDLDPTSPLRKRNFLQKAFEKFLNKDANNLYSVCEARKNPYFNMVEVDQNGYAHLCKFSDAIRRQDAPQVYEMNASIYIYKHDFLINTDSLHSDKTIVYEMPYINSIDIDTELDFLFVEFLLKKEVFKFE